MVYAASDEHRQGLDHSSTSTHEKPSSQEKTAHVSGAGEQRDAEVRRNLEAGEGEKEGGGGELRELGEDESSLIFPPPLLPFGAMEMYALQEGTAAAPSNPDEFGFGLETPCNSKSQVSTSQKHSESELDASLREGGVRARFGPQNIVPLGLRESLFGRAKDSTALSDSDAHLLSLNERLQTIQKRRPPPPKAEIEMEARTMLAATSEPEPTELQPFISENEDARVGWRWSRGAEEVRRWLRLLCCCVRGAYAPV